MALHEYHKICLVHWFFFFYCCCFKPLSEDVTIYLKENLFIQLLIIIVIIINSAISKILNIKHFCQNI